MTNDAIYDGISANLSVQADYSACGAAYSVASAVKETAISTFTISGSKTAFIAGYEGLTWNDFKSGYDGYYYQSESVIDAEKCTAITQDDMMCWAGTAANMLYYTGWDLLDTASEDSVFSVFIDHFTLGELYGGNPSYGIKWFFTGDYTPASWSEWDQPISNSGGYYSDFFETKAISNYLTNKTFNVSNLTTAREKLEDGYGVGITFGYYNSSGVRTGGHVITLWGMTCDTSLSVTDPNYYTGIIVTDSDDNKNVSDPLTAKDTLKIIEISYDSSRGQYVLDPDYAGENCILENLTFLAPNTSANPNSTAPVKIYSNNILVKEGTTFTDEQILADGNDEMLVSSGGTVNRTYNSRARIELFGGLANSTTVTAAGVIYIYSGGTATSTTVDDKSSIGIHADGMANITTVNSGGEMYVFSDGTANNTTINSSGRGNVLGGGVANKVNVSNGGILELWSPENPDNYEHEYASANNVTVFNGGSAVISGGMVSSLLVFSGGIATLNGIADTVYMDIYGNIYNAEIKSGGNLTIGTRTQLWGGTIFGGTITLNDTAEVYGEVTFDLSERETADSFIVDNLAYLDMSMGSFYTISVTADQANGTYKLAKGAEGFAETLTIGDKANNYGSITVNGADLVYNGKSYSLDQANGDLTLTIGTTATPPISGDQVQVYSSGTLVKQGKVLTGETIVSGANNSMFVYKDGTANETVINSKGYMYVSSGGVANKTSVYNDWGTIKIYNSGIAKDTYISGFCAEMYISAGGFASNTDIAYGRMTIYGTASSTTLKIADVVTVGSGGIADKVETNGHVGIYVSSAGLLSNATMKGSGGHFAMAYIRGGSANTTVLNSWGHMHVYSGGTATNTTINLQGGAYVSGGGYAENADVNSGGKINVLGEEYAPTADDYPEALHGSAKNVTVYNGGSAIISGGEVSNLLVSSGGKASVTGVEDVSYVDVSGCIRNGEIKSGGSLTINNGTELWGDIIFGGTVIANGWANVYGELTFDLSERTVNDSYIVDNIANLYFDDFSSCSISVNANQADGTYILAGNAAEFDKTVTVYSGSTSYGTLTVGGTALTYNGKTYTLALNDSSLVLTIGNTVTPPVAGDQVQVYSSGTLVKQGKVLTGETIVSGANNSMFVYDGGTANETVINSSGRMYISSGGVANKTYLQEAYASMTIYSGGKANDTEIRKNGFINVSNGGFASNTTICGENNPSNTVAGGMFVYVGGSVEKTTLNDCGHLFVYSGAAAAETVVNSGGWLLLWDKTAQGVYGGGGTASNTVVNKDGYMRVCSGAFASNTTLWGDMTVSVGSAADTKVNSNGIMNVYSNGLVEDTEVNNKGKMYVYRGGSANNVDIHDNGYASFQGFELLEEHKALHASGKDVKVSSGGSVYISGGEITNLLVSSGGDAYVCGLHNVSYVDVNGRICNGEIKSGGELTIGDGTELMGDIIFGGTIIVNGSADVIGEITFDLSERTVNDSYIVDNIANLYFDDFSSCSISVTANQANGTYKLAQGAASFTGTLTIGDGTVNYGSLTVNGADLSYNGATYSLDQLDGNLTLTIGTNVTPPTPGDQVQVFKGNNLVKQGKILTGETIIGTDNDKMIVYKDGIANKTVVSSAALMYVSNGGVANETTVDSAGRIHVSRGGIVNNTTLSGIFEWGSYGAMNIHNGGTANNTQILSGGFVTVSAGGTADTVNVNNRGQLAVFGNATDITVHKGGEMRVYNGAYVSDLIAKQDAFFGVEVTPDTYVKGSYADSAFEIKNGLVADYTIHKGYVHLKRAGKANGVTVNNKTWLRVYENCTASNTQVNGSMYIYKDGTAENTTVMYGGSMLIEGGKHTHSLNIADGAFVSAYNGGIVDFTVSERKTTDGYLINNISLIKGTPTYTITVSADQANGTYKLAQGAASFTGTLTIGDGSVDYGSITVNGADFSYNGATYSLDQLNGNLTLTITNKPAIAENDLDGNGLADVVLVHTKQGYSGAWLTTGDASIIKWGNLSYLTSDIEILGTGKLHGTENDGQDIFFTDGKSVGAWNVVEGKVTGYKNIMNVNATTNVLGLGDFNGDGATDILLRSTNGDLGYFGTDGTGWKYIKGLGKEWKISAVGDLDGDGCDDVIVRHDAGFTGAYMIDENGKITWSNLDTLKSDMAIVGTGDFNGDGVDDVLLQNKSNGWVGAWLVENGRVDSFIGLCNNKNTIEQIADFNGDGIDDLRIRTEKGDIGVLYVNGEDNTTWKYFQSVGKEWDTSFALLS
ncbi:MAG: hypothetical protein E7051_08370 [Lentisphaerae bacterium]|nr:hypothetical protein [Lentisphaerota bacterium]